jgi:hypothetical protein
MNCRADTVGSFLIHCRQDVRVDVHRGGDFLVPEPFLNDLCADSSLQRYPSRFRSGRPDR